MYSEVDCRGNGSNKSERVGWMKKLDKGQAEKLFGVSSFVDQDGWLTEQPLAHRIRRLKP